MNTLNKRVVTCIDCERRPAAEGLLCDVCERRWRAGDAEAALDVLDTLIAQDAPKVAYRALRKGRGNGR